MTQQTFSTVSRRVCLSLSGIAATVAIGFANLNPVVADEPSEQLTSVLMQDEVRRLPPDNSVLFSSATRSISLRLNTLDQFEPQMLAGTKVTVVSATGEQSEYKADASGVVTIPNVKPGPHAIVANKEDAHAATMMLFKEASPEVVAARELEVGKAGVALVKVSADELLPIVDKYVSPSSSGTLAGADFYKQDEFGPPAYRVLISRDDQVVGQVIPLVREGSSGSILQGNRITLFRGGQRFAQATTDGQGRFVIPNVGPGVYGIVAAGPGGYSAFGFEAMRQPGIVMNSDAKVANDGYQFASTAVAMQGPGSILPVVMIPPQLMSQIRQIIRNFYSNLAGGPQPPVSPLGSFSPVPGAGGIGPGGFGGGGFGGAGAGAGGGAGGLGGLGALAGLGAIGAIAAGVSDNEDTITPPQIPSPIQPGTGN